MGCFPCPYLDREVESLEVLFFSTRLLRTDLFELPVTADLRFTGAGGG
jgi:hypothetical protein